MPPFSYLNVKDPRYKQKQSIFRKRSFLKPEEEEFFSSDKVKLLLKEKCRNCGSVQFPKDILKSFSKITSAESVNLQFVCAACKNNIYPNLKIMIGDVVKNKVEETMFISAVDLRQYLEMRLQLDNSYRNCEQVKPEVMKEFSKNLYWPLIWYFAEFQLPYDFLVPYQDTSLMEEYYKVNQHMKVMKKYRLEDHVKHFGDLDKYIDYAAEQIQLKKTEKEEQEKAFRRY